MQDLQITPPTVSALAGKLRHARSALLTLLALFTFATNDWCQAGPHELPPNGLSLAAPLAAITPSSTAHYKFITIDANGSTNAVAGGINNNRLVSGYFQDGNSVYHGFVWHEGAFKQVDYPDAAYTKLYSLNNANIVIGLYGNKAGSVEHTVLYSVENHKWIALPDIARFPLNEGYGINDAGTAFDSSGNSVAWIWSPATQSYSFFTVPGAVASTTSPSGLNNKGQVAGYFAGATGAYHGFLKEYGTYTTIDVPNEPLPYTSWTV